MARVAFLAIVSIAGFYSGAAQAQALYDVEHARGNYRAGLVSQYDADLIAMWGAPSGNYPGAKFVDARRSQPRALGKRAVRAKRRNGN